MIGYRKWALAAYLALAMYLLARPAGDELADRARALDEHLKAHPTAALSPALAAALAYSEQRVERHLKAPLARPSELVFEKLLDRAGSARGEADAAAASVLESGVSMNEALAYFDAVEKRVTEHLHHIAAANSKEIPAALVTTVPTVHGHPAH